MSTKSTPSSLSSPTTKHPADIAITLYLDHLSSQLKVLSPDYLPVILPLLFRALAFASTPLPRLSVHPHPSHRQSSEDKITDTINALFSGPHATQPIYFPSAPHKHCPRRHSYFPFRIYVRRTLRTRLARAYISRESFIGYSSSGAPSHINIERDLMERAWPAEEYTASALGNGWDTGRL
ncbi:hypothetical protein DXG01_005699 [Tephrocybe rancida]|nr:hypothetical protein DXG01_005699 [Tephrocybe rancida]